MSATRALSYLGLFVVLTGVYVLVGAERDRARTDGDDPEVARFLDLDPEQVTAVTVEKDGRRLRAVRTDAGWVPREPADVRLPGDLVPAIVATAARGGMVEVVDEGGEDPARYGLDSPRAVLRLETEEGEEIVVELGDRNPARTALYARRPPDPTIVLLGLNLWYYLELAMETG